MLIILKIYPITNMASTQLERAGWKKKIF